MPDEGQPAMTVVNYVLFKFAPDTSEADRRGFQEDNEGLSQTLHSIGVESVQCKALLPGPHASISKGYDMTSMTVLRDLQALQAFREAPAHQQVVAKHKPLLQDICATQIEY